MSRRQATQTQISSEVNTTEDAVAVNSAATLAHLFGFIQPSATLPETLRLLRDMGPSLEILLRVKNSIPMAWRFHHEEIATQAVYIRMIGERDLEQIMLTFTITLQPNRLICPTISASLYQSNGKNRMKRIGPRFHLDPSEETDLTGWISWASSVLDGNQPEKRPTMISIKQEIDDPTPTESLSDIWRF